MAERDRLDPVVRLRERAEDEARLRLAEAIRETAEARARLVAAEKAAGEGTGVSDRAAAAWVVAEEARARLLREAKRCAVRVAQAESDEARVRAEYAAAHRAAEAVRRVREARRDERRAEAARRERKELDEIAGRAWRDGS